MKLTKLIIFFAILLICSNCSWNGKSQTKAASKDTTSGIVIKKYPSGNLMSEGRYVNGAPEGLHITYYENGTIKSRAGFQNGKLVGEVSFYHPNGQRSETSFYDSTGNIDSTISLWFDNGILRQFGHYDKGKAHGLWYLYDKKGSVQQIYKFNYGLKNGEWLYFSNDGDTVRRELYENDSLVETK